MNLVDDADYDTADRTGVDVVDLAGRRALVEDQHGLVRASTDPVGADQVVTGVEVIVDQTTEQKAFAIKELMIDRRHHVADDPSHFHVRTSTSSTIPTIA